MSRSLPSQRDVVIGYAPDDGSVDIFEEFEEADGCLLVIGVVEDVWTTFYALTVRSRPSRQQRMAAPTAAWSGGARSARSVSV